MVMQPAIAAAFKRNEPKQTLPEALPPPETGKDAFHRVPVIPEEVGRGGTRPYQTPGPGLDGVYLDSLEMVAGEMNYHGDHFRTASVPLVFDREGRPCQLMIFNTWTFERDIAAQMHARGKLLFANAVLWQFAFLPHALRGHNLKGRSSDGIQSRLMVSSIARALPGMRRMNPRCSSRISMEFTDGGVRLKNRWKSACLGATPASFRIMYSRMKARNCPC